MQSSTLPSTKHPARRTLLAALVALATMVSMGLISTTAAQAAPRETKAAAARAATPIALNGRVTGTLKNGTGAVAGTLHVTRFVNQHGKLAAVGKFTGSVTNAAGQVRSGSNSIALPLASKPSHVFQRQLGAADVTAAATCQILDLVLGPLDLNLLGLVVHLDRVHLNITAVSGPGNLLGNLLCGLAGLLDGSGGLSGILNGLVALLNQLLGMFG